MCPVVSLELDDSDVETLQQVYRRDITPPTSLRTSISPPPSRIGRIRYNHPDRTTSNKLQGEAPTPNAAAIEAGRAQIANHLAHFSSHLSPLVRPVANSYPQLPRLLMHDWKGLYTRNQHPQGRHWVIHQHDHPVAGVHYDLRLQISETSSISWAIMYGLPGSVNGRRLNRNATETRVHNLWNHLIETASASTGSLLIGDTGEYEVLPWHEIKGRGTDDELSDHLEEDTDATAKLSDSEKLHIAFQSVRSLLDIYHQITANSPSQRRIRIRLHGTRLPKGYTLSIRLLTSENRHEQPAKATGKRRRKPSKARISSQVTPPTSDMDEDETVPDSHPSSMSPSTTLLEREIAELEDERVRESNAYPGAENSIGSIHQRRWYLSMDRSASGFRPLPVDKASRGGRREWDRRREDGKLLGFEAFYVMGREVERSVLTGRTADDVMDDEGVEGFVGRKGWKAVTD